MDSIYKLGEVETNLTWIDGKPIYRNIVQVTATAQQTEIAFDTSSIDTFIRMSLAVKSTDPNYLTDYYRSDSDRIRAYIFEDTLIIQAGSGFPERPLTAIVIMEYTKTT